MCGLLARDLCAVFLISLTPDLLLSPYEWTRDDTNACKSLFLFTLNGYYILFRA